MYCEICTIFAILTFIQFSSPTHKVFYMLDKHSALEFWATSQAQFFQLKTAQYVNFIFTN